jgi:HlyD family secretion protein
MNRAYLCLSLIAALALTACGAHSNAPSHDKPSSEAKDKGVPVRTTTIKIASIPDIVSGYGSVAGGPNSRASLAFAESGRIASVSVMVGDHVRAGEALAHLDARPFEADAAQADANVVAARANLQKVQLGSRPQLLAQTTSQIQQAQTQYAVAHAQLIRQEKLLALGVASQADVDAARAGDASAKSQLQVLIQQRQTLAHPWQPDLDAAGANLEQAQAAAAAAHQKVNLANLTAPFDAVVVARLHNDGETVDTTSPIIELASDSAPVFTAQFAPEDAARISTGDDATVNAQGSGTSTHGRVIAINPAQSDQKTVGVLIRLRAENRYFGPGTYGKAAVVVGTRSGLVVPSSAIVTDPATGSVQIFKRNEDHYTPVPVTVTASTDTRAIIKAQGLKPGDVVVVQGAYELLTPQQPAKSDTD